MRSAKGLIREIHRRSLWQVLGVYVVAAFLGYEAIEALVSGLGLPDWFPAFAVVLFIIGLPIVLATAIVQEGGPTAARSDPTLLPGAETTGQAPRFAAAEEGGDVRRLFTWRNAALGGLFAFALWGMIAAGWVLLLGGLEREGEAERAADPNVVAVFPFRVTGADESLKYLREGMVDLLAAKLTGEAGPRAADPRSVVSAWRRALASEDDDLPRDDALELARLLGAGQVLLGGIVGTPTGLVLSASVFRTADGRIAAEAAVEGPAEGLTTLVDRLAAGLLALGAGEAESRLSELTSTSLPALRAYLDGQSSYRRGGYEEAVQHFETAIQIDSAFTLAALGLASSSWWTGTGGGTPFDRALALAWPRRDRLSPRDRALLVAWAGPRYPERSSQAEHLVAFERAVEVAPDRPEPWHESGDILFHLGGVLGEALPWERAESSFRRALELDSSFAAPLGHLLELKVLAGDTAEVRRLGAAYLALDSLGDLAGFIRWRMAHALGDSVSLAALRPRISSLTTGSLVRIVGTGQLDGMALDEVELAAAAGRSVAVSRGDRAFSFLWKRNLALNRGRPGKALEFTDEWSAFHGRSHADLWLRVLDALYWDGDGPAASQAALELASYADGALVGGAEARQTQYGDICVVEQWRLWHGDARTAEGAIARLREATGPDAGSSFAVASLCATLLEALLAAEQGRPGDGSLEVLESLMRTAPNYASSFLAGLPLALSTCGNLVVARLREAAGDAEGALAAVRRRPYHWAEGVWYLSTYLREEGRLAALAGDREGAIRAYQHYLALRSDPEPALAEVVAEVRAELARLLGEAPI